LPACLVSRAFWLHGFLAIVGVGLLAGHLAHVFLTRHGRDSLRAMARGTMSEETARERHRKWWEQVKRET
jgi:cytochrome b subunit of formate dehydrogenase